MATNSLYINTVRGAIDAFKSFMSDASGRISDDNIYPNKLIYYYLSMYRNRVLYEENGKNFLLKDNTAVQTLVCVDMSEVDFVECPCAPKSGCTFMRSKIKLPSIMGGVPISVTNVKGTDQYKYIRWDLFPHHLNSRSSSVSGGSYFTVKNIDLATYLYVYTNNAVSARKVQISAVFRNPLEVLTYPICGRTPEILCTLMDTEFIMEPHLQSTIFEKVREQLLNLRAIGTTDILNNDQADFTTNGRTNKADTQ